MATKKDEERISQDIAGRASQTERVSQDIGARTGSGKTIKSSSSSRSSSSGYTPIDPSGNDYAEMVGMSAYDKTALFEAGVAWNEANAAGDQAGMEDAHRWAEAIRSKYNYSGGVDGSQYLSYGGNTSSGRTSGGGSGGGSGGASSGTSGWSYASAPTYSNKYQTQIDELTQAILGREDFEYNYLEDPSYQQYAESYTRGGQRAMQDTLGQVAARTGGLASSYATAASQQTYDNYMAALADKIPELRQLAYAMYQDEWNNKRSDLEMLMALEQGDYAKYQDLLAQYNTDRSFDYGVYSDDWNRNYQLSRDEISDSRYDMEWNYGVSRDQIEDQRYEDETAWNRSQYLDETEYARNLERAQTLAAAGDFSGYKALGYSDSEIANLQSAYDRAMAAAALSSSGRSSGSSGRSSSSSSGSGSGAQNYEGLYQAALESGYPKSYISNNYKRYGFTSSSGLYDGYVVWADENTYDEADVSVVAKGLLTDLRKYYASQQDQEAKARQEYESGGISWTDYLYLADKLGFGG